MNDPKTQKTSPGRTPVRIMIKEGRNVSTPKNKKAASVGESQIPKPKRGKEKLLRLDDLIPKNNVSGGRQLLFGATDINQTKHNRKRS